MKKLTPLQELHGNATEFKVIELSNNIDNFGVKLGDVVTLNSKRTDTYSTFITSTGMQLVINHTSLEPINRIKPGDMVLVGDKDEECTYIADKQDYRKTYCGKRYIVLYEDGDTYAVSYVRPIPIKPTTHTITFDDGSTKEVSKDFYAQIKGQ